MKTCLYILAFTFSLSATAQSVCGTAPEGGSVTLTAPAGKVFTTVTFASYGTPNGSCGSFTIGGCHASSSQSVVETALLNKNSATIDATNGFFGEDPCGGTVKRLYIEAVYSFPLPLKLVSFSGSVNGSAIILQWQTSNEVNTKAFEVERSSDGINFLPVGKLAAANTDGNNFYSYTDNAAGQNAGFYRLKMIDENGSFSYSSIIKVKSSSAARLTVFPNPVTNYISISGTNAKGFVDITTMQGTVLKRISITGNSQTFDLASYPSGIYILKYTTGSTTLYQKIVKQ